MFAHCDDSRGAQAGFFGVAATQSRRVSLVDRWAAGEDGATKRSMWVYRCRSTSASRSSASANASTPQQQVDDVFRVALASDGYQSRRTPHKAFS
jgi:hypothetical protein